MAGVSCVGEEKEEHDVIETLKDANKRQDEIDLAFDSIILAESIYQRKGFEQVEN